MEVIVTFELFQTNGTRINVIERRGSAGYGEIAFGEWAKSLVGLMKVIGDT